MRTGGKHTALHESGLPAQTLRMKITTVIMASLLIAYGLFAALFALFGVDVLALLTFGNRVLYRAILSLAGVAAAWLLFFFIAFRPMKFLS